MSLKLHDILLQACALRLYSIFCISGCHLFSPIELSLGQLSYKYADVHLFFSLEDHSHICSVVEHNFWTEAGNAERKNVCIRCVGNKPCYAGQKQ